MRFARVLVSFVTLAVLGSCSDPRTGGLRKEFLTYDSEMDQRAWMACGAADPSDDNNILDEAGPVQACHGRLWWRLETCEIDALMKFPDAARAHMYARQVAQSGVYDCCSVGGPGNKPNAPKVPCTAETVDACIAFKNYLLRPEEGDRVVSPGLDLYFADDNEITTEATACFDRNGWTRKSSIMPRICGKNYICPNSRVVVQCYRDGTCDDQYEEITRESPWYEEDWYQDYLAGEADRDDEREREREDTKRDAGIPSVTVRDAGKDAGKDAGGVYEPGDACDPSAIFGATCTGCGQATCYLQCTNGVFGKCVSGSDLIGGLLGDASIQIPDSGFSIRDAGIPRDAAIFTLP